MSAEYDSRLASKCQGVAGCLSFNEDEHQDSAKRALLAASHALDQHVVKIHKKKDGLLIINARGKSRFLTWKERLALWLLDGRFEVRP